MKYSFKLCLKSLLTICFLMFFFIPKSQIIIFNKSTFYNVLATGDIAQINQQLALISSIDQPEKNAYEGALLMKKAGVATKLKEKLNFFKAGHTKLESAINNNSNNIEYHFLRLVIQEKSPKILKYKSEIINDKNIIISSFKTLSPTVQKAVREFSKTSTNLKLQDF